MLKKRLIGVVTVRNGWAVQSFGYRRYLPLGKPECLVENLDRWGADEILLSVIDRSANNLPPDFELLQRIGRLGIETPLIYAGGIRNVDDGVRVIQSGADRLVVDNLLQRDFPKLKPLSELLGAQAVIAALPLSMKDEQIQWLDHTSETMAPISDRMLAAIDNRDVSEVLIIDWRHEGHPGEFDQRLVDDFPLRDASIIAFGGLGDTSQISSLLQRREITAVAVGNMLNYREHAIQTLKAGMAGMPLRPATYAEGFFS